MPKNSNNNSSSSVEGVYESLPLQYHNSNMSNTNTDINSEHDFHQTSTNINTPLLNSLQNNHLNNGNKDNSSSISPFSHTSRFKSTFLTIFPHDKTTNNNILAWFIYLISSEPFIVSIVGTYMPIILETFATLNAVQVKDHSKPCVTNIETALQMSGSNPKCVLPIANIWYVDPSSFALYIFSTSVFFQTILVISVSGLVDNFNNTINFKKKIILFFGVLGGLCTISISLLYNSEVYSLAILCILTNCCYGVINVIGNSLLPVILHGVVHEGKEGNELTTIISGRGTSLGYLSALIVQIVCIALIKLSVKTKTPTLIDNLKSLKLAIFFVGFYWIITQIPIFYLLKDRPVVTQYNEHDDESRVDEPKLTAKIVKKNVIKSWKTLAKTITHAASLKQVSIFLIGWFIISDSITTINSTAILFSKNELHMNTVNLVLVSILSLVFAIIGAFSIPTLLITKFSLPLNKLMIVIITWTCFIPFYGLLGFIFETFGLKNKYEMFFLAVWYGLAMGALNAVSRSIFALIIPHGKESIFFSIFNITDKGSSIVGPVLTGLIIDKTHEIRYAFILLFLFLIVAIPVFNILNVDEGKKEAEREYILLQEVI
ncbi:hypothetical protein ACO0SA_002551 [Hanseniaspora valbyensis]